MAIRLEHNVGTLNVYLIMRGGTVPREALYALMYNQKKESCKLPPHVQLARNCEDCQ